MKKGLLKKVMIGALAGVMLASAGACGGPDSGNSGSGGGETHEDNIKSISLFCNDWEQFNNGAAVNSPIYKELKKVTKCDIKAQSTGGETYYSMLDLMRNKGTLPEMFIISGPKDPKFFNNLIRDEEILAISDYVNESTKDQYPYLYEYMKQYDYMKSNLTYANGKSWFIPVKWSNEKSLYVRRDWIKNLNAKIDDILVADGVVESKDAITDELRAEYRFSEEGPDTIAEFYRLARAFTLYDPDGNGVNDTYGYVTESNRDMDSWLHVAYGTGWKMWMKNTATGEYENSATSDSSMMATALLSKMINEGYVSEEVATKNVGNKQEDFANGKAGMMYAHNWYNVISAVMMSANSGLTIEGAREKILIKDPPKGKNGEFGGQGDIQYYRGWCIKGGMSVERRETCLKLMEYLHSPEGLELVTYGVMGEHWEWKDDIEGGEKVSLCEPDAQGFIQALRWTDYAAFISYLTYTPYESEALLTNGDILTARAKASADCMILSDYPDVTTDAIVNYQTGAYSFFDETVLKMIVRKGSDTLAADWKFDAKTWKTDGMTKVYTVSDKMKTEWAKFVSDYNGTYKGSLMQKEYNDFIKSGKAVKVTND